jgi:hypothetical protein
VPLPRGLIFTRLLLKIVMSDVRESMRRNALAMVPSTCLILNSRENLS